MATSITEEEAVRTRVSGEQTGLGAVPDATPVKGIFPSSDALSSLLEIFKNCAAERQLNVWET